MRDPSRLEELHRRVEADPTSIAFAELAEEYRKLDRHAEAIKLCRTGLARHPAYLSARVTLGRALADVGDLPSARAELEQVLRVAPTSVPAMRALSEVHRQLHDLERARELDERASALAHEGLDLDEAGAAIARELTEPDDRGGETEPTSEAPPSGPLSGAEALPGSGTEPTPALDPSTGTEPVEMEPVDPKRAKTDPAGEKASAEDTLFADTEPAGSERGWEPAATEEPLVDVVSGLGPFAPSSGDADDLDGGWDGPAVSTFAPSLLEQSSPRAGARRVVADESTTAASPDGLGAAPELAALERFLAQVRRAASRREPSSDTSG